MLLDLVNISSITIPLKFVLASISSGTCADPFFWMFRKAFHMSNGIGTLGVLQINKF